MEIKMQCLPVTNLKVNCYVSISYYNKIVGMAL